MRVVGLLSHEDDITTVVRWRHRGTTSLVPRSGTARSWTVTGSPVRFYWGDRRIPDLQMRYAALACSSGSSPLMTAQTLLRW